MTHSFAEERTSSQHETSTSTPIGWCMLSIHTNQRMKLGKVLKMYKSQLTIVLFCMRHQILFYAKEILIEERLNQVSKMIDKSLQDFHTQMK